jgi:micrococcal nuclease
MRNFVLGFLFLCCCSLIGAGNLMQGRVVAIADGDTFTLLLANNSQEKIRLIDIDAPEKKQDFGMAAKKQLSDLIFGKQVNVRWMKRDRNKRIIGEVFINGVNINEVMIKEGFAWQYLIYNSGPRLRNMEAEARKLKKGLWQMPNPVAPWEFRHSKKKVKVIE